MTESPGPLRRYFSVPSTGGFSPYRTGQLLHLVFSGLVGGLGFWTAGLLGAPEWASALTALGTVFGSWGIGWFLGVQSHYVFMPAPVLAFAALTLAIALGGRPVALPAVVGLAAHLMCRLLLWPFSRR